MNDNSNMSSDYNMQGSYFNNQGFQNANALQIRLDTSQILLQIEAYLKGEKTILIDTDNNGTIDTQTVWKGEALMNSKGIQSTMMYLQLIFNPQVVAGNFSDTKGKTGYMQYAEYLCRGRMDLADYLMKNMKSFDIKDENYAGIISSIMRTLEAFMTRLLYNEERKSYAATMRMVETNQTNVKGKGLNIPFFN
jgi:hypothetical protein